ncbi:anti-sigma factor [Pontibacter sp. JH31]|uniref:Regulator of SigK n=1 Tax=Pontibacter aquaedesilientis TaxID=2766980 RepID=A0ABR7XDK0_9BACT|nr:anti-sigma factor [Pontibacter aquaedesilientis]MBD1396359.1 anti-sigma factor [Pontibacter aquaedesilientis]
MHNEEYIASGILELYAAGGLTPTEREDVERRAADSPDIRMALDEACEAMEGYANLYAVKPRPELKDRILQQFQSPEQATDLGTPAGIAADNVRTLYPENSEKTSAYKWMMAASIVLFLLSGVMSFHFYNKWQHAEERLAGVVASELQLAQNFQKTSLQLQNQEEVLAVLRNPDFQAVQLQGVEESPDARMVVYWNKQQAQVYVDQVALPKPPTGKQYQLWALADGKPIDAGMIDAASPAYALQQMKNITAAQAFAVTLEPIGGSQEPTLEQLTVIGNINS